MKEYRINLIYKDLKESTGINNRTNYSKEISEKTFNEIYKLICNDNLPKEENL